MDGGGGNKIYCKKLCSNFCNFNIFVLLQEAVYMYQKVFRNISGAVALLVLVISAYCYKDLHVLNNQLLQDIKKQIENLKIENSVLQCK